MLSHNSSVLIGTIIRHSLADVPVKLNKHSDDIYFADSIKQNHVYCMIILSEHSLDVHNYNSNQAGYVSAVTLQYSDPDFITNFVKAIADYTC